jgi:hypothetical protein
MASFDTLQKLAEHPEWIAPRSDLRVFLGEPGAPEATKTTVEPGNAFSPGMKSFGVTAWLRNTQSGAFFATETADLAKLRWRYEDGYLPLLHCDWTFEDIQVHHSLFQDGTAAERSEAVCGRIELVNDAAEPADLQLFLVIRSLGPAGGRLANLEVAVDGRGFAAGTATLLATDRAPGAVGCGVGDPSPLAREGHVPEGVRASDPEGWCFGAMRFDLHLDAGEGWTLHFDCPQHTRGNLARELPGTAVPHPEQFDSRAAAHLASWQERLGRVDLDVPDRAFHDAFFAGPQHMLTAAVGDQARIAPLSYPLPWLRDSVFIIRCFDLLALHDVARAATEYCARNDFFGGFGPEGDAPGEGLWALVQHYRVTRDRAWLRRVYPAIQRKCDWLFRMRRADQPIQVVADTPTLAFTHAERASGVICLPARDGIIMGTMDHGVAYALGWVNHWSLCGLREAAYAARELDLAGDAVRYDAEADELATAFAAFVERTPEFFEHERTVNSLLWPTRAWENDTGRAEAGFNAWWQKYRGGGEDYRPEPYWLYFEFAQAHNALLLGQRERAWQVIRYRLQHQDLPGLYGWREGGQGVGTENATQGVTLINQLRGCHKFDSITPHGWSQAEMWLLQRAALVEEWQDGLLLFAGVPAAWLKPEARIVFRNFPTTCGKVSVELLVDTTGRLACVTVSGVAPGTPLWIHLPQVEMGTVAGDAPVIVEVQIEPADHAEQPT